MAFSEALKLAVKRRAFFSCCLCHAIGVEVHHIIPQEHGGDDSEDNAAPLCPSCHETYGANPQKRKLIREVRDFWYDVCSKRYPSDPESLRDISDKLAHAATREDIEAAVSRLEQLMRSQAADETKSVRDRAQEVGHLGSMIALLELQERIKPRRLTDKQSAEFVKILKTFPNGATNFGYTAGGGDESLNLLKQLIPLFKEAGWKTPDKMAAIANHLDIQVIGIGVLVPGPKGSDPTMAPPASTFHLTPLLVTLLNAFKTADIDVQFITWYPRDDGIPELVIGSKPNP